MRRTLGSRDARQNVALAAGTAGLVLLSFVVFAYFLAAAVSLALALATGILVVAVAEWSWGARSTWRRASLAGGFSSWAIVVGSRVQDEPWSGGPGYMQEIDRAIGPLDEFLWALAARGALATLVVAGLLFALTCWLRGPPTRKA